MAHNLHPDFKDGVTPAQAQAADQQVHDLVLHQGDANVAQNYDHALAIAQQVLEIQLRV